jgi:predicted dehydrogenase/threonine dehydrogenase-like Zn-dependent dehydrogenase
MKQIVQSYRSGNLTLSETPVPSLQPGSVLVQTCFSAVSVGTEGMKVRTAKQSLIGKARMRPELVRQVMATYQKEGLASTYRKVMNRLDSPVPLGYSLAGRVIAVAPGIEEFRVGDMVACAGAGIANHAEYAAVPLNLCVPVPDGVPLDQACFATIASIALHGVRQSEVQLGSTVAVVGLGLVGLIAVQMLVSAGCTVIGIDTNPDRVRLARELGARIAAAPDDAGVLESILGVSDSRGADCVIVSAADPTSTATAFAARIARDRGRVVILGIVGMNLDHKMFYEKELELRMSRSYGPGRYDPEYEINGTDYPASYVRWTERRNMSAVIGMIAAGQLRLDRLITHRFPFAKAPEAYDLIAGTESHKVLGVVFEYPDLPRPSSGRVELRQATAARSGKPLRIGMIGAGNFARTALLPAIAKRPGVELVGVANATSVSARSAGDRFGFKYATTDAREIVNDAGIDFVVIATRHDQHAALTAEALRNGKGVFVEKPLAINEQELAAVVEAYRRAPAPFLHVGFNRRFAPMVTKAKAFLPARGPFAISYRVHPGFLPREHWYHSPDAGGGRLIGEGCHFIDLMQHFTGSRPIEVFATAMSNAGVYSNDNVLATVRFEDGSVGSLAYLSCASKMTSKEMLEVSAAGRSALIDDFRLLTLSDENRTLQTKDRLSQDKGHSTQVHEALDRFHRGDAAPIPPAELFASTLTTLAAARSLTSGTPLPIDVERLIAAAEPNS